MVIIRFPDDKMECRGLGFLARRFPTKSWANGLTVVPESALAALAREGFQFSVEGPAKDDQVIPAIPDPAASAL